MSPVIRCLEKFCTLTFFTWPVQGVTVLVTVGGSNGSGQLLLAGDNDLIAVLGPK